MSAEVIYLWGGRHEHRIRVADGRRAQSALIIRLPDMEQWSHDDIRAGFRDLFRKQRAKLRTEQIRARKDTLLRIATCAA